jgi:hypothetical protein
MASSEASARLGKGEVRISLTVVLLSKSKKNAMRLSQNTQCNMSPLHSSKIGCGTYTYRYFLFVKQCYILVQRGN